MNISNTRVIFYQVQDNQIKLKRLTETARLHFFKKEHLLILVEDERSQIFADEFLWKWGFLPHIVSDDLTSDYIAIAKSKKNVNQARFAFNLCSTPLLIEGPFRMIYEFEDLTTLNKKNLSSLRYDAYKQAGFLIEAR